MAYAQYSPSPVEMVIGMTGMMHLITTNESKQCNVCPGGAAHPYLHLDFRGQVEPMETGSCIIDGEVMGEQV